jgi:beta-lactamase regulating signal transducer with metallopeptidase domain
MMTDSVPLVLEAALRALAAAVVLWAAMRLLRVENVLAQKAAWGLVLAAALAMPLLMRAPLLPEWAAVRIPAVLLHRAAKAAPASVTITAPTVARKAKPHAAHAQDNADNMAVPAGDLGQYGHDATQYESMQYDAEPRNATATLVLTAPVTHANAPATAKGRNWLVLGAWIAYLCVAGALLLRLLMGLASSIRMWMQAEPVHAALEAGMPAAIAVRASRKVASPVNIGSGIVLPVDYASWDEEKLRVVLAHECSHVRQRDFYLQLAAGLYAAVTWFSPLGWWLRRRLSELGEAISDRAGMEAATSPSSYAQMLLEFAALPRPAYTGVAMAHSSNLSERIERLLNDSSFRKAFSGSRRALLVLVPAVLFATTALVRVQAARVLAQPAGTLSAAAPAAQPSSAASPVSPSSAASQAEQSGQAHPADAQVNDTAPAPAAQPSPDAAPQPAPRVPEDPEPVIIAIAPPPAPPSPEIDMVVPVPPMPAIHIAVPMPMIEGKYNYAYYSAFGDAYAVVGDPGTKVHYAGDWEGDREADVEKARAQAHGHFLLFRHDDKTYLIDDQATVTQIEAMQKPMEDLGTQMRALGKQMRDEGQQDREAAREAARQARDAQMNIPTPDLTKEMADLNAAVAALKDKQSGTVTREQLRDIQRSVADLQRRLINAEVKVDIHWNSDAMTKMNLEFSKYGQQMGELGKQMGELGRQNNQKIKSIIDESLKDGKAKPVQ